MPLCPDDDDSDDDDDDDDINDDDDDGGGGDDDDDDDDDINDDDDDDSDDDDDVCRSEFETRNLPENIREIWGPVLLQKLPEDVTNRCAFAVHKSVSPV